MITGHQARDRVLERLLVAYVVVILLLVAVSARLWWQSPMQLVAHEFDYFLGLFASSDAGESGKWFARGRMLHAGLCLTAGLVYLAVVRRLMRNPHALTKGWIVCYSILVSVIYAMGMPWLSPDVFYYIGKGWAESHYGASPYLVPISNLPGYEEDQMVSNICPGFLHAVTGYGPLFQKMSEVIAALSGGNEKLALALHKSANVVLHGACAALVYRLAPAPFARVAAFSYAINPLICFSILTCVHNDHWMNMFMLLALLALSRRRWLWVGVATGAAFGVKYFPLVYVPIFGLAALVQPGVDYDLRRRVLDASKFVIGFSATVAASFLLFYPEALSNFASTLAAGGMPLYRNSIYHLVDLMLAYVLPGVSGTRATMLSLAHLQEMGANLRMIYVVIYAVGLLLFLRRMRRDTFSGSVEACLAMTVIYFIVANSSNMEWYLTWLMGLALVLPYGHAHSFAWRLSAFFLPLVIYTIKSGSILVWLLSNAGLYILLLALGGQYLWRSRKVA